MHIPKYYKMGGGVNINDEKRVLARFLCEIEAFVWN